MGALCDLADRPLKGRLELQDLMVQNVLEIPVSHTVPVDDDLGRELAVHLQVYFLIYEILLVPCFVMNIMSMPCVSQP